MSKWKKFTVYNSAGVPVFKFQSKKIRKGRSVEPKHDTVVMGFAPPVQSDNICRCG